VSNHITSLDYPLFKVGYFVLHFIKLHLMEINFEQKSEGLETDLKVFC
jgi:hypothetical protein